MHPFSAKARRFIGGPPAEDKNDQKMPAEDTVIVN